MNIAKYILLGATGLQMDAYLKLLNKPADAKFMLGEIYGVECSSTHAAGIQLFRSSVCYSLLLGLAGIFCPPRGHVGLANRTQKTVLERQYSKNGFSTKTSGRLNT